MLQHHVAAAHQHNGGRCRACQHDQRDVQSVQTCCTHRCRAHLFSQLGKFLGIFVLDDQCLGGLGSHNALVVCAGQSGVDRAHLAVPEQNLLLEIGGQHGYDWNDNHNQQRQPQVQNRHRDKGRQHIGQRPQNIHHIPCGDGGNLVGIAHHTRQNISHRCHIVVRKGEGLQMDKARLLQVASHVHLHLHRTQGVKNKAEHLQNNHYNIPCDKRLKACQRPLLNKVVHRIPLEKRQQNIHHRNDDIGQDQQQHQPAIWLEKREQTFPGGKLKGFVVLHSIVTIWICQFNHLLSVGCSSDT